MARSVEIRVASKATKVIRVAGRKSPRVSPNAVAKALGGEVVGKSRQQPLTPIGILALREQVTRLLVSSGGRPALEGSVGRQKIPLHEGDWQKLKKMAAAVATGGVKPTPGQMASLLLHRAIAEALGELIS